MANVHFLLTYIKAQTIALSSLSKSFADDTFLFSVVQDIIISLNNLNEDLKKY